MDLSSEERSHLSDMVQAVLRKGDLSGAQFFEAVRLAMDKNA